MRTTISEADSYIQKVFENEPIERLQILQALKESGKSGIEVSATEGRMLKLFSRLISARKIVEIGTLYGYSTSWLLESLPETGKLWSVEKNQTAYAVASRNLKAHIASNRLSIFLGVASNKLKEIEAEGPFDLVFIDANKSGYLDYFDWADKNLRSGGLVIADNTFLLGKVFSDKEPSNHKQAWKVMREFNQTIAGHPDYFSALIPTAEGLTLAFKK